MSESPESESAPLLEREDVKIEGAPVHESSNILSNHDRPHTTSPEIEISKSPRRPRPWSTEGLEALLAPSPSIVDSKTSKDDIDISINSPTTPKRPNYPPRGLSLQMPPRDVSSTSTANLIKRVPLSPKLDPSNSYASPGSALPRRSRGLDFSRACTNLHHSTLAEQSSPDSSPVVGNRASISIPSRRSIFNSASTSLVPESPGALPSSLWSTMASSEKGNISGSLGSASMMDFDSASSSSDEDAIMGHNEEEDTIHMTPQIWRSGSASNNLFGPPILSSPGGEGGAPSSAAATKLMSFQRARTKQRRSRKWSSSTSGHSALLNSGPASPPPVMTSIERSWTGDSNGDPYKKALDSRRKSLSLGTCELDFSDGEQSENGTKRRISPQEDLTPVPTTPSDERRNVIRRAVNRRGNLLPKSRNFSRIWAALQEEGAPVDSEVKREAEVIRQARESDAYGDLQPAPSQPVTTASSPSIQPATAGPAESLEDIAEDVTMDSDMSVSRRSSSSTFTQHAIRNSAGLGFWNTFDERIRTPPPIFPRESSSGISDDIPMDTPQSSIMSSTSQQGTVKATNGSESRSTTPQLPPQSSSENLRKGNKRMRDDDFDPYFFKRRAVSPGMSLQNSPILPQSPLQRDGGWWGVQSKYGREASGSQTVGDRISSGGS
ncbi:MAG: hypothetical protein Q9222_005691, partial [Ikaeria aurantiellina]